MPTKKTVVKGAKVAASEVAAAAKKVEKKAEGWFANVKLEDNIHMIIGIILLVVGLYQLRQWILGLVLIILGILFVTGYFEKKAKK